MVQSARSIVRAGYSHRVHPVMPYAHYPQQYEESLISPFNSYTYFGKGTWARTVRSAADSVREWREQGEQLLQELQRFLGAHTSPWHARKLTLSNADMKGKVQRGARIHTYSLHIVAPAQAEMVCSYELAQDGLSIAEPGRHRFLVRQGEQMTELSVETSMTDTNGHLLAKLQQTIQQADLGIQVDILADNGRQLLALELKGSQAFCLTDLEGSVISAVGAGQPSSAAEHARVQLDGGSVQTVQNSLLTLDAGRVKLQLDGAGTQPSTVKVEQDQEAVIDSIRLLMEQVNSLINEDSDGAELLNPELRDSIQRVMNSPSYSLLGFSQTALRTWSLDTELLAAALADDPGRVERELGGPYGWAGRLNETIARLIEWPAREMMNPADQLMHQFTLYESSMQSYWHVPHSGWMINEQA